jgi:hypothetical protein
VRCLRDSFEGAKPGGVALGDDKEVVHLSMESFVANFNPNFSAPQQHADIPQRMHNKLNTTILQIHNLPSSDFLLL